MFHKRITAAVGTAALLGGLGVAALASAGAASASATYGPYTTSITNDPDSGNAGNWATDAFTRTSTLTDNGVVSGHESWTLVISDSGTFAATAGASNPNGVDPSDPIDATSGAFSGGGTFNFTTASGALPASPPSGPINGAPGTSTWYSRFFSSGVSNVSFDPWSWTYTDTLTCEKWVDSSSNGDGHGSADGGITGDGQCNLSLPNPGTQTATVGTPFSLQLKGATTGTSALSYTYTGLPADGLSGSTSGKISGTPVTTDAIIVTATVTDAAGDFCGGPPKILLAWTSEVPFNDDTSKGCSVTFEIDVVAAPTPTPTPTVTVTPPPASGGVPTGGVQTGGGLPQHSSPLLPLGFIGLGLIGTGGAMAARRRVRQGS
jgi:hypothetical protein